MEIAKAALPDYHKRSAAIENIMNNLTITAANHQNKERILFPTISFSGGFDFIQCFC
jgi:hypothetical protein